PKGVDGFEVPNRLTILMASNESWVVPATSDERRYVVFDVSDCRRGDFTYFMALNEALDGGELKGFLHDMLEMDLKGWHPRQDIPATQGLADQQAESASPMVNWLGTILEEGALPHSTRDATGQTVRVVHRSDPALARPGLLWEVARKREHRLQHESDVTFWKFLDEHGITRADEKRTGAGRYRRFPPLPEARAAFADKYSFWPEFSDPGAPWRFDDDGRSSYSDWEDREDAL
ncbi:MAG: primase-helicase family protein, partial [Dehalococcoidia bacterium]